MRIEDTPTHGAHTGKKLSTCGCSVSHCCLTCVLAVCVLDVSLRDQRTAHRTQRIRELRAAGKPAEEIAVVLGISKRSVHRGTVR